MEAESLTISIRPDSQTQTLGEHSVDSSPKVVYLTKTTPSEYSTPILTVLF
ncbi:hypothetical protein GGR06_003870 [Bacteroides reticulotermitis]|uniref:Uncharacterized protein n=1 Tax=Bacteroides reticulotermitis TaxID=1133319 RepID=A0A840D9C5_9BACE|nr:hypothetical protein [Bacteroides reticulotermitis]